MKLTPLDIRKQEFSRRVRGVDEEEVRAFLQMIASQWEEIQDDQRRLEDKVRDLEGKLQHYKQVEEALQEALRTARENAKDALETARQKAQVIIHEAEATAVHVKRDADDERRKMRRQISRLTQRRDEIVSRLRAFLMSEMEMLARFEGDDAVGFIKLMPAQERGPAEDPDDFGRIDRDEDATRPETDVPALQASDEAEEAEEPDETPAPLPAWAQFEDDLDASGEDAAATSDGSYPAQQSSVDAVESDRPEAETLTDPVHAPATTDYAVEDAVDAPDDGAGQADRTVQETLDADEALERFDGDFVEPATFSDGGSVDHDAPTREHQPSPDGPAENSARSRWLSEHLFSAFRRTDGAPAEKTPSPGGSDIDDHGWERHPGNAAPTPARFETPTEEEEESFTVSSEEVERIRRILKGLD